MQKKYPDEYPNALNTLASLITDLRALYIHKGGGRVMNSSLEWRMETEYERERERERKWVREGDFKFQKTHLPSYTTAATY